MENAWASMSARAAVVLMLVSLPCFASCSRAGGGTPRKVDPTSPDADACALLTKSEAETVLEEPVGNTESGPLSTQGGVGCIYSSSIPNSGRFVSVRIERPSFDWDNFKEEKRVEGELMRPVRGELRAVVGLGQDAYFARHSLHVKLHNAVLTVTVLKDAADLANGEAHETPSEALERQIAVRAMSRMRAAEE